MSFFLKPAGIFDLEDSDCSVGSYFKKEDLKKIFNASDDDFKDLILDGILMTMISY